LAIVDSFPETAVSSISVSTESTQAQVAERIGRVLAPAVAVMDEACGWPSALEGEPESGEDQLGPQVVGHGPAHDPTAEAIQDDCQVAPPLASRDIGDIGEPEPVGPADPGRREGPVHPVRCRRNVRVGGRRAYPAALVMHAA